MDQVKSLEKTEEPEVQADTQVRVIDGRFNLKNHDESPVKNRLVQVATVHIWVSTDFDSI